MAEIALSTKFKLKNDPLREIIVTKEPAKIEELGGVNGIAEKLLSSTEKGLCEDQAALDERQAFYGKNEFPEAPAKNFFVLFFNALKEPILILLGVCAIVEIILGVALPHEGASGWIDGVAILIAVLLVSGVTAGTDYDKDKKFRALNSVKNDRKVKVRRNGEMVIIQIGNVQVGDVILLDTGDYVPADGVYIDGHAFAVDESAMTGESDSVKKNKTKPVLLSGTQVSEGSATMLATNVGLQSEWGITYSKLIVPAEDTPLQESLGELAKKIGYIGMVVAVLTFIVLCIQFIASEADTWEWEKAQEFLRFFTLAITIVVVAVPEGLPLAVTLSLAYSMKAMLQDKNLVRHLAACETMGGATNICSDKTGTLTENRMTVTNIWVGGNYIPENLDSEIPKKTDKKLLNWLASGIATNSGAHLKFPANANDRIEFIGSKTECALLVLAHKVGYDYVKMRNEAKILQVFPFSSEKKRMSTIVQEDSARIYTKGASEIILGLCVDYIDASGNKKPLPAEMQEELKKTIESMASEGLRTLCLGYKDIRDFQEEYEVAPDDNLTLLAIVGIKDPLRPEVPDAIRVCKEAGITVRMVTGDNKLTASRIAADCGILTASAGEVVMEGPDFRKLTDDQLDSILPKLKVLARSSPSDKHRLVTRLKAHKEVVAVTGDGTNDGPALKAADVGFGMGIAGTEIAKEAADIIIMDDNFASIVQAVKWGRCVRGNIQKFLQFQLTVNMVALTVALVAAASGYGEPIRPIQFLWVNLIQDTLAALALATEKPTEELLKDKPAGRHERLITPLMWRNMVCIAIYQIAILFMILYAGESIWGLPDLSLIERTRPNVQYTILFNTFVFLQIFNEINCRLLNNDWNAFRGFFKNWLFSAILVFCIAAQVVFIEVGGDALSTRHLNVEQWFACLGLGASILIVHAFVRAAIPVPQWEWLRYNKKGSTLGDAESGEAEDQELNKKEEEKKPENN